MRGKLAIVLALLLGLAAQAAPAPSPLPGIAVVKLRVTGDQLLPEDRDQSECCLVDGPFRPLYTIEKIYAGKVHGTRITGNKYYGSPTRLGLFLYAIVQDTGGPEPRALVSSWGFHGACFIPSEIREYGVEPVISRLQHTHPCKLKLTADDEGFEPDKHGYR